MVDPVELELHNAALLQQAREWFIALQLALLAVAGVVSSFVIRKRIQMGRKGLPRPLEFAALMLVMFGMSAVFTKLWGFDHLIFAFSFGVGLTISLVDPVAAVGFLLANALIRPWEMSGMPQMAFIPKTLFVLTMGSWIIHSARSHRLAILMNRPCRLFYALAAWFLVCALTSGDFMGGLTKYSGNVLIATIIFVLVSNAPQEEGDLDFLLQILAVAVTGLIAHAILVTVTQTDYDPSSFRLEDAGTVGNSNDLAALITIALPFLILPAWRAGRRMGTLLISLASFPVLIAGLWISQSRGAVMALTAGSVVYGVARAKNKLRAAVIAALCALPLVALSSLLTFSRDADDLGGSTNSRLSFMIAGVNMGLRNPILGIGHDNFAYRWEQYAIGQTYESGNRSAHSSWIIAFAENGFPGLLLLLSLFVASFRRALWVQDDYPELLLTMAAYAVAMTFLAHAYTIYPYMIFALILAAAKIRETKARTENVGSLR